MRIGLAIAAVCSLVLVILAWRWRSTRPTQKGFHCPVCGFGLPNASFPRCPACGDSI